MSYTHDGASQSQVMVQNITTPRQGLYQTGTDRTQIAFR